MRRSLAHRTDPSTAMRRNCGEPARRSRNAVSGCSEPAAARGRSHEPEQTAEVALERAAELEARAVVQEHHVLAMKHRLELLDPPNVDDGLAVDAHEPRGIERPRQLLQ